MWNQRRSLSVWIWFQDWPGVHLGPESTVPMHPQPRPLNQQLFFDFYTKKFPEWGLNSFKITFQSNQSIKLWSLEYIKGGPEPSNFEDLCLVNVSVKYFSKLCFGTNKIQPELKYLKTILEVFTSWFQRAKAWELEFGRVPSISFIFTGSKMARISKSINHKYFETL